MPRSIRHTLVAAVLATPLALIACGNSAEAPKTPAIHVLPYVGDGQVGLAGWAVNVRPAVKVTDSVGKAITGAGVTFAITGGGGSATQLTTTTNGSGVAQVGSWTLGASAGPNTMTATVTATGFGTSQYAFVDTGVAAAQYTIQIQYYGKLTPTAAESAAFNYAVSRWQQMVFRHVGTQPMKDTANSCGAGEPAVNQTVTDLLILASFDSIDGKGKTLAEASPCFVRLSGASGAGLTVMGVMKFDTADVGTLILNGQLNAVVLHEMGHVLGFGTLWSLSSPFPTVNCLQLPSTPPGTLQDTYFSCLGGTQNAAAQFDSLGGTSYTGSGQAYGSALHIPPVENCANSPYTYPTCGQGTVNGHWRTTVFGNELMVGFLPASPALSKVTLASLQDLGYTVNYAAADSYTHTFTAPPVEGAARVFLGDDIHHGPLYAVDPSGRITLVHRRQ